MIAMDHYAGVHLGVYGLNGFSAKAAYSGQIAGMYGRQSMCDGDPVYSANFKDITCFKFAFAGEDACSEQALAIVLDGGCRTTIDR